MATNGMSLLFRLPATLRPATFRAGQSRAILQLSLLAPSNPKQYRAFTTNTPSLGSIPDTITDSNACSAALQSNKRWAQDATTKDPELFEKLSKGQSPPILWLGCSDSRCPETTLLGLKPGDVFVHRNIANVLHPGDLSSQSVIYYAVGALKVKHVVVCGHTSCGGVAGALGNSSLGPLDMWLEPIRELRAKNAKAWEGLDEKEKALKLVEANVRAGVDVVRKTPTVIEAMKSRGLTVHGMIYNIASGQVEELDVSEGEDQKSLREAAFSTT